MIVTPDSIANEVRLARTQVSGPFVITEGAIDSRVYRRTLTDSWVSIVGFGRDNVRSAIGLLARDGIQDNVGILDADFTALTGGATDAPNLLHTDAHDIEVMLLGSPALEKVVETFGSHEKVLEYSAEREGSVRDHLFASALPLGLLRFVSERDGLNLRFEGLTIARYVDRRTLRMDTDALVAAVVSRTAGPTPGPNELIARVAALEGSGFDPMQACCGPDIVAILSIALRSAFGSRRAMEVSAPAVLSALELSYEAGWFAGSSLHGRILDWELRNFGGPRAG